MQTTILIHLKEDKPRKKVRERIRLTKEFMREGYKVENYHEEGYIIIFQEVEEK